MYKCKKCGSAKVQHAMWVELNTERVHDTFGTWNHDDNSFCPNCEEHGTIEEVKTPCELCGGLGLIINPSHIDDGLPTGDEPYFTDVPSYQPPTIERCDLCKIYNNDDEAMNVLRAMFINHKKGHPL